MSLPPSVLARAAAAIVAVVMTAGSAAADAPSDCGATSVERTVTLQANAKLDPQTIDVCRDQQVTIAVTVHADGILHIHGSDDLAQATSVTAGTDATLAFKAIHPGHIVIELHATPRPASAPAC